MSDGEIKHITEGLPVWDIVHGKGKITRVNGFDQQIDWFEVVFHNRILNQYRFSTTGVMLDDGLCEYGSRRTLYFSEPVITGDLLPKWVPMYEVGKRYVFFRKNVTSDDLVGVVKDENQYRLVIKTSRDDNYLVKKSEISESFEVGKLIFGKS